MNLLAISIPGWVVVALLVYATLGLVLTLVSTWLQTLGVRPSYVRWQHLWSGSNKAPLIVVPALLVVACSMTVTFLLYDRRYLWQEARATRAVSPASGA